VAGMVAAAVRLGAVIPASGTFVAAVSDYVVGDIRADSSRRALRLRLVVSPGDLVERMGQDGQERLERLEGPSG
jgi:hypothetical protein